MSTETPDGIAVYAGSADDIRPEYIEAAHIIGAEIARRGLTTVNGGGNMGLMRETIDGALAAGGRTIGVLPQFMMENDWDHKGLTECRVVSSMHERKATMAALSRGVIALPGGIGTFEEVTEMMTWRKLGLFHGNVVILNICGFYDPLLEMFRRAESEHFMKPNLAFVTADPVEAVAIAAAPFKA